MWSVQRCYLQQDVTYIYFNREDYCSLALYESADAAGDEVFIDKFEFPKGFSGDLYPSFVNADEAGNSNGRIPTKQKGLGN